MGGVLRTAGALLGSLLAMLAGCKVPSGGFDYGVPIPQRDPTVVITEFSYTPLSPVHVGDKLTFTAALNKPIEPFGWLLYATMGSNASPLANSEQSTLFVELNDSGFPPDVEAGDGIWAGEYTLPMELGPQNRLPVAAELWDLRLEGPPLTVLPEEEE